MERVRDLSLTDSPIDLTEVFAAMRWPKLAVRAEAGRGDLQGVTPFDKAAANVSLQDLESLAASSEQLDRAMGCLVGLAVADSVGHPLEFLPVASDSGMGSASWSLAAALADEQKPDYGVHAPGYTQPWNKFQLDAGQWTDDTSMALCLADSLLKCGELDGVDVRLHFWSWWFCGLNNAFRKDQRRVGSVGLGGNISQSLYSMRPREAPSPTYEAQTADAGNGSLMRLAPIALHHLRASGASMAAAHTDAKRSSLTTHPGPIATEACAFLTHLLIAAMTRFSPTTGSAGAATARSFLISVADEYETLLASTRAADPGVDELRRLLRAAEPEGGTERCWNWRGERLDIGSTMEARGDEYNGYPNSAGYFGSYCLECA